MAVAHYENFPVASLLLPPDLREPVSVIYRFARTADDFADEGDDAPEARLAKLNNFTTKLLKIKHGEDPGDSLFRDVARIVRAHSLPLTLFEDLLSAFRQDVEKGRYESYAEVLDYCRRSANPIGRLLLHLFKQTTESNLARSDAICTALQIINFWQDVRIDLAKDRVYLPQDEMRRFGVSEAQLREGRVDDAWQKLMAFQCDRARALMLEGAALKQSLRGRIRLEIAVTIEGGLRILEKLKQAGYDMFRRRPVLKPLDWPLLFFRAL
ncbi:MAG TPA: squalene synthase HpnC [Burkholderiales bacterium]|jgi:phytoene synthase|nr:squalene synthase HpnC [Burkholderiales bacterium]